MTFSQAVRLESVWTDRVRYMVVVYSSGRQDTEENILLGVDFSSKERYVCGEAGLGSQAGWVLWEPVNTKLSLSS